MCMNEIPSKRILIADPRGPEKRVLVSILSRLGYKTDSAEDETQIKQQLAKAPELVILNSEIENGEELAFSIAGSDCRILLLDCLPESKNSKHDFTGFIDITEHILRGISVKVPEIVMIVNDFISAASGKGHKRQPRIPGGYAAKVKTVEDEFSAYIFNLSASGAFIEMTSPPVRGTLVDLSFELPGYPDKFSFKSKITWRVLPDESSAMRSPPGCGVYFTDISKSDHKKIEAFVINKGKAPQEN